jgi:hypothetical protein
MPSEKQMFQDVQDEKDRKKADKAYSQSLRNTEYAPKFGSPYPKFGSAHEKQSKISRVTEDAKSDESEMPKVNEMGDATGMKKGGMTASKRADGCAVKGKTKGTII